ncbi:DUF4360 domain-containing protein [Streptomyces sp. NPDC002082]|uniref:DUF4360 domain-containing protein n=1 Tax=Streptomyces sp. NPDC002082 TaxID=3154772 RepID=UPI00332DAD02
MSEVSCASGKGAAHPARPTGEGTGSTVSDRTVIKNVGVAGSDCPSGSYAQTTDGDGDSIALAFEDTDAHGDRHATTCERQRGCRVVITYKAPLRATARPRFHVDVQRVAASPLQEARVTRRRVGSYVRMGG